MMNIAFLSEKYTPEIGGLAISAERFGRLLTSAGHRVQVFAPSPNLSPSECRTLLHSGVSITRFGAHKRVDDTLVDWLELLVQEHERQPFDVLQAYFLPQAGFVAAYAGKLLQRPSVVSIRGNDIERAAFDPARFSQVMYSLKESSAVTTNTGELRKKAQAFVDREIHLIPNGVDTELFQPQQRNEALAEALGVRAYAGRVIGFVGELRGKKGLDTLLRAYTQVNRVEPAALLIVGEVRGGEDREHFDELHSSIPNSKITITGAVSNHDLPSYYSVVDVFAHPSLRDGMPNALLEAMACGKPVIATAVGGALDVLTDCEDGLMIPVKDVPSLASAIQQILSDKPLQKHLGTSARQTVRRRFSLQQELQGHLSLYRALGVVS